MVANGLGTLLGVQNVVLVGYPTYPLSTILQQRDFVTAALRYIQSNTEVTRILSQNNTTADSARSAHNIVLCGHSSGANICALSLLDNIPTSTDSSTISPFTALNVHTFIGLAGVYDIGKHYLFESNRGVHVISPMCSAACGRKCFGMCSPTVVARGVKRQLDAKQAIAGTKALPSVGDGGVVGAASGAEVNAIGMPHTVLIHGWGDMVVPYSSSAEFGTALQDLGVQVDVVGVKVRPGVEVNAYSGFDGRNTGDPVPAAIISCLVSVLHFLACAQCTHFNCHVLSASVVEPHGASGRLHERRIHAAQ
jgi:acetyl esterase/lipase